MPQSSNFLNTKPINTTFDSLTNETLNSLQHLKQDADSVTNPNLIYKRQMENDIISSSMNEKQNDNLDTIETIKIKNYNQNLLKSKNTKLNEQYQTLASITTVSKFSQDQNYLHVDGKLLFGVLNGQTGDIEECLVMDEEDTYFRSNNVFVKHDFHIGNRLYMSTTDADEKEKQNFMPIISVDTLFANDNKNDSNKKRKRYAQNIKFTTRSLYETIEPNITDVETELLADKRSTFDKKILSFGNPNINYLNLVSNRAILTGVFKTSDDLKKKKKEFSLISVDTNLNRFQNVPTVSLEQYINLQTDDQFVTEFIEPTAVTSTSTTTANIVVEKQKISSQTISATTKKNIVDFSLPFLPEQTPTINITKTMPSSTTATMLNEKKVRVTPSNSIVITKTKTEIALKKLMQLNVRTFVMPQQDKFKTRLPKVAPMLTSNDIKNVIPEAVMTREIHIAKTDEDENVDIKNTIINTVNSEVLIATLIMV